MSAPHVSRIDLTIDELVLHGFPRAGRYRIAEAMQQEMATLIEARGFPPTLDTGEFAALSAPDVQIPAGARPEVIGRQIALALYEGLEQCAPG
jgi:hypothetical protein